MVAIKDREMPRCCVTYDSDNDNYIGCPFYKICECRETIKTNFKPTNCPLVEIVTCKECEHSRTCVIEEKTHRFCNCEKHRLQEVTDDYFCGDGEMKGKE